MTRQHTLSEGIAQARREMAARERRDVSGEEIAEAVGVTPAAYSRWEKGQRAPREEDVAKLAAFFGVTPAYLRYGVTVPMPPVPAPALPPMDMGEGGREFVERVRREKAAQKGGQRKKSGGRGA